MWYNKDRRMEREMHKTSYKLTYRRLQNEVRNW